jgi:hypothetical protein
MAGIHRDEALQGGSPALLERRIGRSRDRHRQRFDLHIVHGRWGRRLDWHVNPHSKALVRARASQDLRAQKSRTPEYSRCSTRQRTGTFNGVPTIPQDDPSSRPLSAHHAQRARAAHRVLEQLERDGIANLEVIERGALLQIRAMKINLAPIRQADEPVALTNQEVHNPTGHERATGNTRPREFSRPLWRAPARPGVEIVSAHVRTEHRGRTSVLPRHAHDVYQRGSERRRRESPPPK